VQWCGHCKNLAPHYERAAQAFRDSSSSGVVRLAAVDADAHPNLGHRFGVKGFPTIKFFAAKSTEGEEYSGARTAEGITTWINNKLHTDVTAPASADFDASAATTAANNKAFEYPSVLKLNSSNVDAIIGGATGVLVEFYVRDAHWSSPAFLHSNADAHVKTHEDMTMLTVGLHVL
jgi:protein disulfide-isomerase-like protein